MTDPENEAPWLRERRRTGAAVGRLYGGLAVGLVLASSLDLYEAAPDAAARDYGPIWQLQAAGRGVLAGLGPAAVALLVLVLAVATLAPVRSALTPVAVTLLSLAVALLVARRVGLREPLPELADGAQALIAVAVMTAVVGLLHTVRLFFGAQPPDGRGRT